MAATLPFLAGPGHNQLSAWERSRPYGLNSYASPKPYLGMPDQENGPLPQHLSETAAFRNVHELTPTDGLIPYDLNVPFYSDDASKSRWVAVPREPSAAQSKIRFASTGEWKFPKGTVFVKHFEIVTDETRATPKRRLETRILVRDAKGGVYGVTYKWRPDNSDADLLTSNLWETISIRTATGTRTQAWYYPSRADCRTCHTDLAGGVLGVKTRQLNRDFSYPNGVVDNELRAWNHVDLFDPPLDELDLPTLGRLARGDSVTRTLEDRARSYLDANCAHCHRPGGTVAYFDTRYDTPLTNQNLIDGPVLIDEGIDKACVIAPNDIWRSIAFMRINTLEAMKMPPLAHQRLDEEGTALLRAWIQSLPGPRVVDPPTISPPGSNGSGPIEVTLSNREPGATIRYTLDGSVPTTSDPLYERPLKLTGPTVLRAKAFKPGFTRSITVQNLFLVDE